MLALHACGRSGDRRDRREAERAQVGASASSILTHHAPSPSTRPGAPPTPARRKVELVKGDRFGGPIRWRLHLPVSPSIVFEALDSDAGRAAFWAESAVEIQGAIEFRFINGVHYRAAILERRVPEVFEIEYFGSPARFELEPDGAGGTDLLLTHTGVPAEEWIEVHAGWLNVLLPLKAWVVHRVDLRNHDVRRSWDQGYADQ